MIYPYAPRPSASLAMRFPQQTLAVELRSAEMILDRFAHKEAWVARLLERLTATYNLKGPLNILDIGAAQGSITAACIRLGHSCVGVDPAPKAIDESSYLAAHLGLSIEIKLGCAEALPFPDNAFDLVLANSVLEHCANMEAAFREIHRVLARGGVFWFSATSSLSFQQNEIRGFPLFAWYPLRLKRRIMFWSRDRRPHLIGHTTTPAINWLRPKQWKQKLREVNFSEIHDRWSLRANADADKPHGFLLRLINAFALLHFLTDVALEGVAFGARKV